MIYLILLLLAVILLIPITGADYHLRRILHMQRRRMKSSEAPSILPMWQEAAKKQKLRVSLADVRDFVISLQLGTSMEATLTGSLARAAEQFSNRGVFGERLRKHVESRLSISPDEVLKGLVEDFDCPQLADVLDRVRMASEGGVSYTRVLGVSASAIEEDIRGAIEQQIQKAPIRLTLPMVGGVFFPALVLGLVPLMIYAASQMRR